MATPVGPADAGGTPIDSLGLFAAAVALPEQIERAAAAARDLDGLPDHEDIENVVVLGVGAAGLAGDLLTVTAGPFMPVPVVVHKGYGIPNFIDEHTLVFALSLTDTAEEVLEGAAESAAAGGRLVCLGPEGDLSERAEQWGVPHLALDPDLTVPRAALGAAAIPPMVVLEAVGLFPGGAFWIDAAVAQLRRRRDQLAVEGNAAAALARRIGRTFPLVYGAGGIGAVAALRWKQQFNENAKVPAFAGALPEVSHSEIAGFGQHGDITRQLLHLVLLRHDLEHPQLARHVELVTETLREVVHEIDTVAAEGEGPLAQLLDLALMGDLTSLHLAAQEGVDPGPLPAVDDLEAAIASGR